MTEGLNLAAAAKAAVAETHASRGGFVTGNNASYGLPTAASITGNAVTSVGIGANGVITITYNNTLGGSLTANNTTMVLTPTAGPGGLTWGCTANTTLPSKYRPANCR